MNITNSTKQLAVFLTLGGLLAFGCASTQLAPKETLPEWTKKLPEDPDYLYATGAGHSRSRSIATKMAETQARSRLALEQKIRVEGLVKGLEAETGLVESSKTLRDFRDITKQVYAEVLTGCRTVRQFPRLEDPIWYVDVLVQVPLAPARAALMDSIQSDREMRDLFEITRLYQELEAEVKAWEARKQAHSTR